MSLTDFLTQLGLEFFYGAGFGIGFVLVERLLERLLKLNIKLLWIRHKQKPQPKKDDNPQKDDKPKSLNIPVDMSKVPETGGL